MDEEKKIIGLVGSPNKDGRTNEHVVAALEGCKRNGANTELIQLSEHVVDPCKDCLPWICKEELKCTYPDEAFEFLSGRIVNCAGLVFGTPVYWWDTSAMVKCLILKMFRVFASTSPTNGIPAFGIGIAGGTGNGLVSGLRPVYHFFQMLQMRPLDPVPVTRFNYKACIKRSGELGEELAKAIRHRQRFNGREETLGLYDTLPFINMSRLEERRLLASLVTRALPEEERDDSPEDLMDADILAAEGRTTQSAAKITQAFNRALKRYDELNP
jgi:NAD(P)H-dependent FMN reductase